MRILYLYYKALNALRQRHENEIFWEYEVERELFRVQVPVPLWETIVGQRECGESDSTLVLRLFDHATATISC